MGNCSYHSNSPLRNQNLEQSLAGMRQNISEFQDTRDNTLYPKVEENFNGKGLSKFEPIVVEGAVEIIKKKSHRNSKKKTLSDDKIDQEKEDELFAKSLFLIEKQEIENERLDALQEITSKYNYVEKSQNESTETMQKVIFIYKYIYIYIYIYVCVCPNFSDIRLF